LQGLPRPRGRRLTTWGRPTRSQLASSDIQAGMVALPLQSWIEPFAPEPDGKGSERPDSILERLDFQRNTPTGLDFAFSRHVINAVGFVGHALIP
ncbi:MAG: hypothetical protein MN733_32435, partial [Nitrososphaera sp.]|nr:hypothetical protein [Nitrososphaera sp.]